MEDTHLLSLHVHTHRDLMVNCIMHLRSIRSLTQLCLRALKMLRIFSLPSQGYYYPYLKQQDGQRGNTTKLLSTLAVHQPSTFERRKQQVGFQPSMVNPRNLRLILHQEMCQYNSLYLHIKKQNYMVIFVNGIQQI